MCPQPQHATTGSGLATRSTRYCSLLLCICLSMTSTGELGDWGTGERVGWCCGSAKEMQSVDTCTIGTTSVAVVDLGLPWSCGHSLPLTPCMHTPTPACRHVSGGAGPSCVFRVVIPRPHGHLAEGVLCTHHTQPIMCCVSHCTTLDRVRAGSDLAGGAGVMLRPAGMGHTT